jgi:hypothetical protein
MIMVMPPPPSTSAPSFGYVKVDVAREQPPAWVVRRPDYVVVLAGAQTSTDGAIMMAGTFELLHEDPSGLYYRMRRPRRPALRQYPLDGSTAQQPQTQRRRAELHPQSAFGQEAIAEGPAPG